MSRFVQRFLRDQSGATAVEYGLIAALMSVIVVAAVPLLRDPLIALFGRVSGKLDAAGQ
ncbi:MAG: Flp family type IVb pilin [Caulobacter sp.]|jgi:pilus assembly protein Flp/PilA|nr:Flp family type IVb pilin [Caulobacter sp.]MBW8891529.1 Flp family type IVb pilin [Burkholderiales bacterium]